MLFGSQGAHERVWSYHLAKESGVNQEGVSNPRQYSFYQEPVLVFTSATALSVKKNKAVASAPATHPELPPSKGFPANQSRRIDTRSAPWWRAPPGACKPLTAGQGPRSAWLPFYKVVHTQHRESETVMKTITFPCGSEGERKRTVESVEKFGQHRKSNSDKLV